MESIKRRRRLGAQAWGDVLRRFEGAGTSVTEFCKREGVAESSFHRWRSRLGSPSSSASPAGHEATPEKRSAAFVDLGSLGSTREAMRGRLDLKLDLGGGLTLHLVRG
jgi:putative transposase